MQKNHITRKYSEERSFFICDLKKFLLLLFCDQIIFAFEIIFYNNSLIRKVVFYFSFQIYFLDYNFV